MVGRRAWATVLAAAGSVLLGGCNAGPFWGSAHAWDSSGKRVWTGDGSKATLSADFRWDFVRSYSTEQWRAGDGREWDPSAVVAACDRVQPTLYAWGRDGSNRPVVDFPDTRTVVCLDPTVVVISPGPRQASSLEIDASGYGMAQFVRITPSKFYLPLGYQYGTTVPRGEGLRWFSPEFSPEARPLAMEGERGTIALPGGRLVFKPAGRRWRVVWERAGSAEDGL